MTWDPTEFGQAQEEVSEPLTLAGIGGLAAQGAQIVAQASQQAQKPDPAAVLARQRAIQASRTARANFAAAQAPAVQQKSLEDEVEYRTALVSYYRSVLENPLFDGDDACSTIVANEIRDFVSGRLQQLLGMGQPEPKSRAQFTDAEASVLRMLAARVMQDLKPEPEQVQVEAMQVVQEQPIVQAVQQVAPVQHVPMAPAVDPKPRVSRRPRKAVEAQMPTSSAAASPVPARALRRQIEGPSSPQAPSGEAAILPVPMPRGSQMESVMAYKAAQEQVETEKTFNQTMARR